MSGAWYSPSELVILTGCHFCIDVTFEIRTVLSGFHLFNDTNQIVRPQFYIKQKWRGRE
jgi:hypothetical protein